MSKAVICAGILACVASGAMAADILPPAPSLDSPALRGRFDMDRGAYVRADASLGLMRLRGAESSFTADVPGFRYDSAQLGHASAFGLGAGYQFSEFLRADLTAEYRAAASYKASASYGDLSCVGGRCSDGYAGAFRSTVLMANGYAEVGSWFDVTPFVGLGLGVARIASAPVSLSAGNGHGEGASPGASRLAPAFALMAGASYELTRQIRVEASYRYMTMGSGQSGAIACAVPAGACAGQTQHIGLGTHDLRIGLRYAIPPGAL